MTDIVIDPNAPKSASSDAGSVTDQSLSDKMKYSDWEAKKKAAGAGSLLQSSKAALGSMFN